MEEVGTAEEGMEEVWATVTGGMVTVDVEEEAMLTGEIVGVDMEAMAGPGTMTTTMM